MGSEISEYNILIAGVGGQGNLLSSQIVATAALSEGFRVRAADVFGAAQRGGSVLSHIRIGSEVFSPIICQGGANVLLGFEPVESLRALKLISSSGYAVVNTRPVYPRDVNIGRVAYPSVPTILSTLQKVVKKVICRDYVKLAEEVESSRALNVIMVGTLAGLGLMPIRKKTFLETMTDVLPKEGREMNIRAFEIGYAEAPQESDIGPARSVDV